METNPFVSISAKGAERPAAGFSQVVLPDISIDIIEHRAGNDPESGTHKLPGLAPYDNAILRPESSAHWTCMTGSIKCAMGMRTPSGP
jgi:hypothetical protein